MNFERRNLGIAAAILLVALTAVYWNHFDNGFYFDDSHTIVNNAYITDIANLPLFFVDARTTSSLPTNQAYRPMVTALNAFDYWLAGGLDPRVFHWHMYMEFIALLVLLFMLFDLVFRAADHQSHPWLALFATALFAFHTATAETLNYIIARSDSFSTLMIVLGFVIYTRTKGWRKQLGVLPLILGTLAKPTALMLAPLLFCFTLLLENPALLVRGEAPGKGVCLRRAISGTTLYFVLGALLYLFTRSMFSETWTPGGDSAIDYLKSQAWVIWVYVRTFFVPTGLTADTDLQVVRQVFTPRMLWGLLVISALLAIAWVSLRRRISLPIGYGILWFFIALAPSSSVIPLAEVMNHHRTFFPYIGLVMSFVWALHLVYIRLVPRTAARTWQALAAVACVLLLALHGWGTYQRNEVWGSARSLWKDVTEKSPANGRGLMNYGLVLMKDGDLKGAVRYFERARGTTYGRHPYLFTNLGIAKGELARRSGSPALAAEAEQYLRRGVQLGPGYPATHFYYARWLARNGRPDEALAQVEKSIALSPADGKALELRDQLLASRDRDEGLE